MRSYREIDPSALRQLGMAKPASAARGASRVASTRTSAVPYGAREYREPCPNELSPARKSACGCASEPAVAGRASSARDVRMEAEPRPLGRLVDIRLAFARPDIAGRRVTPVDLPWACHIELTPLEYTLLELLRQDLEAGLRGTLQGHQCTALDTLDPSSPLPWDSTLTLNLHFAPAELSAPRA